MTEAGNGSSGAEAIPAATPAPAPTPSQVQPNYSSRWTSPAHSAPLTCVAWSPSGRLLAAGSADACLRLYRLSDSRSASAASGVDATAPVAAAASVSPDADDVPSLTLVCEVPAAHEKGINDVVFTHDEQHLVTASDDRMLIIWNIVAAESSAGGGGGEIALQPARTCVGHTSYVFCCAVNRAGNLLVSGSYDESVRVWDVRSAKCLLTIAAHSDPVSSVDFSRDGTMVASASYDGLVRVWERASGRCLKTLCAARAPPASLVRFSPNGRFLLAATLDNTLRLWDYSQKESDNNRRELPMRLDAETRLLTLCPSRIRVFSLQSRREGVRWSRQHSLLPVRVVHDSSSSGSAHRVRQ